MPPKSFDVTNVLAGLLFIALGLAFGLSSAFQLEIGTAFRMGPGYAPLALSVVLVLLGAIILLSAFKGAHEAMGPIAWRGLAFILPAPILFGLTVRPLGFVPAVFLAALLASFAAPRMRPLGALLLALGVTVFATLVFSYALGLPFRRFGPWLD
jgi:hypothetical protein